MPKGRYQRGADRPVVPSAPPWPGPAPQPEPPGVPAPPPAWPAPPPGVPEPPAWPAPDLSDPYAAPPAAGGGAPPLVVFAVGVAAGIGLCVLAVFALYQLFVHSLRPLGPPESWRFDDPDVVAAVAAACADLSAALEDIPPARTAATAQGTWLRAENDAIDDFVAQVRRVGQRELDADEPATTWLDDWLRLRNARASYAEKLDLGVRLGFEPPLAAGGTPLVTRMDLVGNACAVPPRLYDIGSAVNPPTG